MHGTEKGKEGTDIKGRQGRTHFDCSKLKKRSRKLKVRDAVFSELVGYWEEWRAPLCSLKRGGHSGVFETQKQFFFSKMSTQARSKKLNGSVKAE